MPPNQIVCNQCALPIPETATRCAQCGAVQSPDPPGFTDRPVFQIVSWLAGLITSISVIFGVASYVGNLVPRSETKVTDISPDGTSWYIGYENIGNATARFGSMVVTQIYPEGSEGGPGGRSYLPLELVGDPDALFIAPQSSRALKIPFDPGAERPVGTVCELKVEVFEHGQREPRELIFRRACPTDVPGGTFDRPVAQDVTDR